MLRTLATTRRVRVPALARTPGLLAAAAVCLVVVWPSTPRAEAATVVHLPLDALIEQAEAIVRAQSVGSASRWQDGRIVTRHRLRVVERLQGPRDLQPGARFTLQTLGGTVGERRQHVPGELRLARGADVYLFLRRIGDVDGADTEASTWWRTLGLAQGALLVCDAELPAEADGDAASDEAACRRMVRQDLAGLTLIDANTGRPARGARPIEMRRTELLARIGEALDAANAEAEAEAASEARRRGRRSATDSLALHAPARGQRQPASTRHGSL